MSDVVVPVEAVEIEDDDVMIVGMDGEMSAADIDRGGRLIQAGFAMWTKEGELEMFTRTISWPEMWWDEGAARVHGLTREEVDAAASADEVDAEAYEWLVARGATPGRRLLITAGFNVGRFDHPYFNQAMPRTMTLVSRRSCDLNSSFFMFDRWDPNPANQPRSWFGWKRSAKTAANKRLVELGVVGREHDAGYDAAQALLIVDWVREQLRSSKPAQTVVEGDPVLVAVFGTGAYKRLAAVPETILRQLAANIILAGVDAGKWLGSRNTLLDGNNPMAALIAGEYQSVLAASAQL